MKLAYYAATLALSAVGACGRSEHDREATAADPTVVASRSTGAAGRRTLPSAGASGTSAGRKQAADGGAGARQAGGSSGDRGQPTAAGSGDSGGRAGATSALGGRDDSAGVGGERAGASQSDLDQAERREPLAGPSTWDHFEALTPDRFTLRGRDIQGLFIDTDENIVVGFQAGSTTSQTNSLAKLDKERKLLWQKDEPKSLVQNTKIFDMPVHGLAGGPSGEIYVAGSVGPDYAFPGQTSAGSFDISVARYSKEGELVWKHQLGSSGSDDGKLIAVDPMGAVYVTGSVGGQLPGQPAELRNQPFLLKMNSDGERVWYRQYKPLSPSVLQVSDLDVDAAGNAYCTLGGGATLPAELRKTRPDGDVTWTYAVPVVDDNPKQVPSLGASGLSPTADRIYSLRLKGGVDRFGPGLAQLDGQGTLVWSRKVERRTMVIDPAENVEWTGEFASSTGREQLFVTKDAIVIGGAFTNTFQHGSQQRPAQTSGFVAKYDLDGELLWFQQFVVPQDAANSEWRPVPLLVQGLAVDTHGDVFVAGSVLSLPVETMPGSGRYTTENAITVLKLSSADGHVL